ncbi:response regulator transcription factor [soil metagenome]
MFFLKKNKTLILYGCCLAALVGLLKMVEYRLVITDHGYEIYMGIIALLFTILGIWLANKLGTNKQKQLVIEKEVIVERETIVEKEIFINSNNSFVLNETALANTAISTRELDVLQLMGQGLSNQEIADALFVSVNTVKTHAANLFFKLDVPRRTQAVARAKELSIIP